MGGDRERRGFGFRSRDGDESRPGEFRSDTGDWNTRREPVRRGFSREEGGRFGDREPRELREPREFGEKRHPRDDVDPAKEAAFDKWAEQRLKSLELGEKAPEAKDRPRLNLVPRASEPKASSTASAEKPRRSDPFGGAKPRDETLFAKRQPEETSDKATPAEKA